LADLEGLAVLEALAVLELAPFAIGPLPGAFVRLSNDCTMCERD
jgi:hypothetical protein